MDLLDLKTDIVFKLFFSEPENKELLIDFVSAFIKPATPIKEIVVLNPILLNKSITHKESILDLRLKLDSGEQLDVEMQMIKKRHFKKRMLYYWAKLHQGQIIKGEDYQHLKKTVSIAILNYVDFVEDKDLFHHLFEVRNRVSGELFVEDLQMHILELPKLEMAKNLGHIEKWGRFFLGKLDEKEGDEMMAKAKAALMKLSADEEAYQMAWDREESEREQLTMENERKRILQEIEESRLVLKKSEMELKKSESALKEDQSALEKRNEILLKEEENLLKEKIKLKDTYKVICQNLLKMGMSLEQIAETVNLQMSQVLEILKEN